MSDTVVSTALAAAPGFAVTARYTRLQCEIPDYEGLWIEARTNLLNGERRAFLEEIEAINAALRAEIADTQEVAKAADSAVRAAKEGVRKAANGTAAVKRKAQDALAAAEGERVKLIARMLDNGEEARRRQLALVCPYVRAWNVMMPDPDAPDDPVKAINAPAPAVAGLDAFEWTDGVVEDWIREALLEGYRSGKGVRSKRPDASPPPTSGPRIASGAAG